jgi:site-specific recombinase XerD
MTTTAHDTTDLTTGIGLDELAASWATFLEAERKAPGTVRVYASGVAAFIAWHRRAAPGLPVVTSSLDRKTAAAFLADVLGAGAAPATARARHAALRQFSAWLAAEGETETDPLLTLKPPKLDQARVDSISGGELDALIRACRAPAGAEPWEVFEALRDEAVIRLLADTGARAGELVALRTADVDVRARIITIRRAKGGKQRLAAFSASTARAIDRYLRKRRAHKLAGTGALWLGTANRGWTYHACRGAIAKRAALAGVKGMHPHRLRHTAASAALDAGMSEGDVMAAFGWSSRAMLDRYVQDTAQRRAAENFKRYFDGQGR